MRDGHTLQADLYLPLEGKPSDYPCILVRCPAGRKADFVRVHAPLSKEGYVVIIQDTRCAGNHKQFPYFSDGDGHLQDGYDTVEWIAKSPYSNGKVGTIGISAAGITQLMLATSTPPSLAAQYIGVVPSSLFHHVIYSGGQFCKEQVEGWLCYHKKDPGVLCFVSSQPFYNEFWDFFDTNKKAGQVRVPALFYGGWYDVFLEGTLAAFNSRNLHGGIGAKGRQKLIIGPWSHYWPQVTTLGSFPYPKASYQCPVNFSPKHWFDLTLKGKVEAIDSIPAVTYYVMGPFDESPSKGNVWKQSDQWPPKSEITPFYLTEDHSLQNAPGLKQAAFTYHYNPHHPVPTIGGNNLFMESGPMDQSPNETREDVLVFTTPALTEDVEVTGKLEAKIFFSSDQLDTDLVVRLTDVYPDGRSILITDGVYRIGHDRLNSQNQPKEVTVDLSSTSIVFAKGHKIRVAVTSSNYPAFEKNCNVGFMGCHTGGANIAKNKVWLGKEYPSRILLPIVHD